MKDTCGALINLARAGNEADEMLYERLRNRGVNVVVGHLIADAIGAPAQCKLGKISGPDHQSAVLVGEPK